MLVLALISCSNEEEPVTPVPLIPDHSASIGITGDTTDVQVETKSGIVLMGGSTDVDEAILWMTERARGGDFLIIRATGSTGYNDYIFNMGTVNSVETLLIDSRTKANRPETGSTIRNAEAVFIAGGDQWNYVNYWKDTQVSEALKYLIEEKGVPIGGTSAGCAILGQFVFDARNGTITSREALSDPFHEAVSLSEGFVSLPFMQNVITDQHYTQRDRHGRHLVFMARLTETQGAAVRGIGVDEKTAVCVDEAGNTTIFGTNAAYFIRAETLPEQVEQGSPLHWHAEGRALSVFRIAATSAGTSGFNLNNWPEGEPDEFWYAEQGVLKKTSE